MAVKNLVSGIVNSNITTSAITISVSFSSSSQTQSTISNMLPATPFYATLMPKTPALGISNNLDSEIVKVTATSVSSGGTATFTVTRGQRGTTAKSFSSGDLFTAGVYCEDVVTLDDDGEVQTPGTAWLKATDIIWSSMIDKIYPIGSIYMSSTLDTAAKVSTALGGTWQAWGSGRVPVGVDAFDTDFSTPELVGGEKTHTLTENEMPSHNHKITAGGSGSVWCLSVVQAGSGQQVSGYTNSVGGGQAHNNLQPYITCYMYKRIS